jgi:LacI family transcriptional regulator
VAARRTTLREVARLAGVSPATASKVLNQRPDVSEATRAKVLEHLRAAGYERVGDRTTSRGGHPVVALMHTVDTQYAALILEGILAAAQDHDADVVVRLVPAGLGDEGIRRWLDDHRDVRGVIAVTSSTPRTMVAHAERYGIPLVAIDPVDSFDERLVSIGSTNWAGGRSATEHLIGLGHRSIAWIGGPRGSMPTIERFQGFRSALERAGIEHDERLVRYGTYEFGSGQALGGELLDAAGEFTAVVCASDSIAFGVMEAARHREISLPEQLSITGFDDVPQADWFAPKLTSVRAPLGGIGRMATETVLGLAEGRKPPSHHIELSTTLVVRESTAPPP